MKLRILKDKQKEQLEGAAIAPGTSRNGKSRGMSRGRRSRSFEVEGGIRPPDKQLRCYASHDIAPLRGTVGSHRAHRIA